MLKIVVDQDIPYIQGVLEPYAEVRYLPGKAISPTDLKDADALIVRTRTSCDATLLKGSSIRFIATATIGYDHIDRDFCQQQGITWTNAPGCNSWSVQQYIAAALLHWVKKQNIKLSEQTLGVVGVGQVGTKVAQLGDLLGVRVLRNDPPRQRKEGGQLFCDLDTLINQSDIISLHTPLNREGIDKTFHLIDAQRLVQMKGNALLINSSRGEVVDNQSLKNALETQEIAASILDVWEQEPNIDCDLLKLCELATPHIAGYSADGKATGTAMSVQAVSRFFDLPLTDWQAEDVPKPENPLIEIDNKGLDKQQLVSKVMAHIYPIVADDGRLRQAPQQFEHFRASYPLRREAPAYNVHLSVAIPEHIQLLQQLRFSLV